MKKKNIQQKDKPNFIEGLKQITNWIVYNNSKIDKLEYIIDHYKLTEFIIKRLYSYIYSYPHIIYYCNEYLNDKYIFSNLFGSKIKKQENLIKFISSFAYILHKNNCSKQNFMFIKNDTLADKNRDNVKNLLNEYFNTVNGKIYNESELNFLYDLFIIGKITDVHLMKIDQVLNNGKSTIKLQNYTRPKIKFENEIEQPQININQNTYINEFNIELNNLKKKQCHQCSLYNDKIIKIDSNVSKKQNIDIAFFNLNSSYEDYQNNLICSDVKGQEIRKKLNYLSENNVTWLLSSLILCKTTKENIINNNIFINCQHMFKHICQMFPAKYYVFFGSKTNQIIGIKGKISQNSGKLFNNYLIPVISPESLKSKTMLQLWEQSFQNIYQILNLNTQDNLSATQDIKIQKNNKQSNQNTNIYNFNISQDQIITEVDDSLTFFDVKEISKDKIMEIYCDSNGNKKYLFKDYILKVNIKNNNFLNCKMIDNQTDTIVNIKGSNKYYISKLLNDQLSNYISQ